MAMACMKMALLLHLLIYSSPLMAYPVFLSPSPSPSPFPSWAPSSLPSQSPGLPAPAPSSSPGVKGGYWLSWRSWNFTVADVDTAFFTHVYYAFVSIDAGTYQLLITQPDDQMLSNFTATLHSKSPPAKALLSVGGATASPSTISQMVGSKTNRAAFINSTIAAARKYNLDGFDLDWEYPSNQEDMDNLGVLFEEWRAAVAKGELLITAAVYFSSRLFVWGVNQSYPGDSIRRNVDWVNIMSFDYKGSWNTTATGAPAALYDPDSNVDTSYGVDSWLAIGVPPEKVIYIIYRHILI